MGDGKWAMVDGMNLLLNRDFKMPEDGWFQRKYMLTDTGRSLATALPALLAVSIQQLTEKAA